MKRNLIYFVCPLKHNNVWLQNVQKLVPYLDQFNGKKIVTIAQGENCVPVREVFEQFPDDKNIQFVISRNNKELGETPHFVQMAKMVESIDPNEITFYAHAKGVSYNHPSSSIRIWCDKMYHHNLACMDLTEYVFSLGYDSMGCFRRVSNRVGKDKGEIWHFSGTFFWFRHSSAFCNQWEDVIRKDCRWGVEGFLGKMMPIEKSFCIYGERVAKIGKRVHLTTRKEMWNQDTHFCRTLDDIGWKKPFPPELTIGDMLIRISKDVFGNDIGLDRSDSVIFVHSKLNPKNFQEKFDIAFISGYTYEESKLNWNKALSLLNPNGIIIMRGVWTWTKDKCQGDAYKTVVEALSKGDVKGITINSDNGISIFWNLKPLNGEPVSISYEKLKKRPHLMHLIDCCDVNLFMKELQRYNEDSNHI